jgi:hypothetical protein
MGAEMTDLRRYRRKEETHVLAVQLDLETDGFTYRKWAVADEPGVIATQEGATHYQAGDYLVYANRRLEDGYAISAERFTSLYELDD